MNALTNLIAAICLLTSFAAFGQRSREIRPWSWAPLKAVEVPASTNGLTHPVDRFLFSKPPVEAETHILKRRLYFDLIGLPPSAEQVNATSTYESLIDDLLKSPHYGERWGRHWLDVVRYTESQGFEYDKLRDNAWHYRDYVIQSFNADKPYDQFIKEQIAGDVLEPVTTNSIIATSLLVCGPWDEAGSSQANKIQRLTTREEELEDLVGVVSQTFLATTMNCARCHAHKFDPIPHKDYYRFKAVFEGVKHGERPMATPAQLKNEQERINSLKSKIRKLETDLAAANFSGAIIEPSANRSTADISYTFHEPERYQSQLRGGAIITNGMLLLTETEAYLESDSIEDEISEKTLEAWIIISDLDQRGGGVVSLEGTNGSPFDSIVFGERQPRKWTSGSDFFTRTRDLSGPEETAVSSPIHIAIVYAIDGTIKVYRNGSLYGESYKPGNSQVTYKPGNARVLLGKRHSGGNNSYFKGAIIEAAIYKRSLTSEAIKQNYETSAYKNIRLQPSSGSSLKTEIATLKEQLRTKTAMTYAGIRVQPEPTRLLKRGEVKLAAEVVSPGSLSPFTNFPPFELAADSPEAERRKALAEWIAHPENPLTARVMVNRIWQYHFGEGLVATPNDFGNGGSAPTHPELLDWLAKEFINSGWSIKKMHKLILTSSAYKAAGNKPRRMESEQIRDALLAISGQLNPDVGGPSFRPFDELKFGSSIYTPQDKIGREFNRRSVYRMNVNSGKDALLDVFDCPDPSVKTPRRNVTTTPLQALALMNNSFVQRQAEITASNLEGASGAVEKLYLSTLGRLPDENEKKKAQEFVNKTSLTSLAWALFNSTEFLYVQ